MYFLLEKINKKRRNHISKLFVSPLVNLLLFYKKQKKQVLPFD